MSVAINEKVIAIQSFNDGTLKSFGNGVYIGDKHIKDHPTLGEVVNPCIKLDTGQYVWGFQCWWQNEEKFRAVYGKHIKSEKIITVDQQWQPIDHDEPK